MKNDDVLGQQPAQGVELQKLSLNDVLGAVKRLSISSILWLFGSIVAVAGGVWTTATWYQGTFGSQSTGRAVVLGDVRPRYGGITDVAENFSNEDLKRFLMTASSQLTVVVPWFIDPLTIADALKQIVATDGASITVFFLDPSSPHLAERGRVARPDLPNYGPGETRRSIGVLGPLFSSAKAGAEMRTYNSIPSAFIVRADSRALIGFHMHTGVALKTPIIFFNMFENNELTPLGRMVEGEFSKLKTMSRTIDPVSVREDSSGSISFSYVGS